MLLRITKLPQLNLFQEPEPWESLLNSLNNTLNKILYMSLTQPGETITLLFLKLDWNVWAILIINHPQEDLILKEWSMPLKPWNQDQLFYYTLAPITQLELTQPLNSGEPLPLLLNKTTYSHYLIQLIKDMLVET